MTITKIVTEQHRELLKDAFEALQSNQDRRLVERMHDLLLLFDRVLEEQRTR
jgi:hypothetical protein